MGTSSLDADVARMYIKLFGGAISEDDLSRLLFHERDTIYIDLSCRYLPFSADPFEGTFYCTSCDCHFSLSCPFHDNLHYAASMFRDISNCGGGTRRMSACEHALLEAAYSHKTFYWLDTKRCIKVK